MFRWFAIPILAVSINQNANATNITFAFTASITTLFEYDKSTDKNHYVSSSTFAGKNMSVGDSVIGNLSFDTDAPLSQYYQPPIPQFGTYTLYTNYGPGQNINFSVGSSGTTYSSSAKADDYTLIQVANDATTFSGSDIFSLSNSAGYDSVMLQTATLNLFDNTAKAFNSSAIPTNLSLSSFQYTNLDGGWLRQSDGNQLHLQANLNTLTPLSSPVPELNGQLAWLLGLASISLSAGLPRRERSLSKH